MVDKGDEQGEGMSMREEATGADDAVEKGLRSKAGGSKGREEKEEEDEETGDCGGEEGERGQEPRSRKARNDSKSRAFSSLPSPSTISTKRASSHAVAVPPLSMCGCPIAASMSALVR